MYAFIPALANVFVFYFEVFGPDGLHGHQIPAALWPLIIAVLAWIWILRASRADFAQRALLPSLTAAALLSGGGLAAQLHATAIARMLQARGWTTTSSAPETLDFIFGWVFLMTTFGLIASSLVARSPRAFAVLRGRRPFSATRS